MRILGRHETRYDIAMTPLIDMMFLLIIFFLVSTAFIDPEKDQAIKLPEVTQGVTVRKKPDEIIVNVRRSGVLVVGGRIVTIDELEKRLRKAAGRNPEQIVKIRADGLTFHKYVTRVYAACSKAKIRNITVVTRVKR